MYSIIPGRNVCTLLDLQTSAMRKIFTSNDTSSCLWGCGIPFQPTTATGTLGVNKLSTAQQTLLNTPTRTDGDAVVAYAFTGSIETIWYWPLSFRSERSRSLSGARRALSASVGP